MTQSPAPVFATTEDSGVVAIPAQIMFGKSGPQIVQVFDRERTLDKPVN